MELKVKAPTFPEVIEFNFDELKAEVAERAANYVNLVYTDDQISEAKKDRAALNKFVKALSDERIKIKKECLKPYEDFEKKIKELDGIVNQAIKNIDDQVKAFEEQKKAEKLEQIQEYWNRVTSPEHPLTLQRVMNPKWLNASTSMKSIQEEINGILAKYASDIATLQNMPEISFEAIEVYKTTLDLGNAISEGKRLSDMQKRKEEDERLKAEANKQDCEKNLQTCAECDEAPCERTPRVIRHDVLMGNKPVEVPEREWIGFKAHLTVEDAEALAYLFASRQIPFEQIAILESEV